MPALQSDKLELVRGLVARAPDRVVQGLEAALANGGADALTPVYDMVRLEAADRARRNAFLGPVAALCQADGRGDAWLRFPPAALGHIWLGLKRIAPEVLARADAALIDPDEVDSGLVDAPARLAGQELRVAYHPEFVAAAAACNQARPGGAAELAACLALVPLARKAMAQLPRWISYMDGERIAVARLLCRDAAAVADDAGPRLFEMLAAQLAEPWRILRVISAVMDHPGDTYFAASEFADFGERVLAAIEAEAAKVAALRASGGPGAGKAAGLAAAQAVLWLTEVEQAIELARDGPWGRRVAKLKRSLADVAEARLKEIDEAVAAALPCQSPRGSRLRKAEPLLLHEPDEVQVGGALALLTFAHETQGCAAAGGFASARLKALERLEQRLDTYVEDVLERLREGEAGTTDLARAYLAVAADFYTLARDDKAGELVRRRMAAAA
ncbi:MAG: hypothetical protein IT546_12995 [Caulobacteraceae bacterium]|nr:hypothetical protein [Caulobacteraceae bacterium]